MGVFAVLKLNGVFLLLALNKLTAVVRILKNVPELLKRVLGILKERHDILKLNEKVLKVFKIFLRLHHTNLKCFAKELSLGVIFVFSCLCGKKSHSPGKEDLREVEYL
jgi:hypothetical protein